MKDFLCFPVVLIAFLASVVAFVIVDDVMGTDSSGVAVVLEKVYEPSRTSTGVGTVITPSGGIGTGVVSSYSSEEFILLVETVDGVETVETTADRYFRVNPKDTITYTIRRGWVTGWIVDRDF